MINLTPHAININGTVFEPSGKLARVSTIEKVVGICPIYGFDVVTREFGEVVGLPEDGSMCLVSAMVLSALPKGTKNVFAPDTGPTAVRDEKGQILYVTRLVGC